MFSDLTTGKIIFLQRCYLSSLHVKRSYKFEESKFKLIASKRGNLAIRLILLKGQFRLIASERGHYLHWAAELLYLQFLKGLYFDIKLLYIYLPEIFLVRPQSIVYYLGWNQTKKNYIEREREVG